MYILKLLKLHFGIKNNLRWYYKLSKVYYIYKFFFVIIIIIKYLLIYLIVPTTNDIIKKWIIVYS